MGLSQPRWSELERGLGRGASLETWAVAAAAVADQLAAFLERAPGADRPRDLEHLLRQNALVELSTRGGWSPKPELALDDGAVRGRSIDVALTRLERNEAAVAEIWDWIDDVGAAWRGLDAKKQALRGRLTLEDRVAVGGIFILRATRRNRRLVSELRPLFRARFGIESRAWMRSLTDPEAGMPTADGLLWSLVDRRLVPARLA